MTLCKLAKQAAKAERPDVEIYANIDTGVWGRATLEKGLLDQVDGISFHSYGSATGPWDFARREARVVREAPQHRLADPVPSG